MNPEREQFLNLKAMPARLTAEEAGWYLGFGRHEIPLLVAGGLLRPLGHPPVNGVKYFATASLAELHRDAKWLARASDAVVEYWQYKNARKLDADESSGRCLNGSMLKRRFDARTSTTSESVDNC